MFVVSTEQLEMASGRHVGQNGVFTLENLPARPTLRTVRAFGLGRTEAFSYLIVILQSSNNISMRKIIDFAVMVTPNNTWSWDSRDISQ